MTGWKADGGWLDAMYNNRALVPGFAAHLERWSRDSEAARQGRCELDIAYGSAAGERLDVFMPADGSAGESPAPVLVYIHGGYWRALDKRDQSFVAPPFTLRGACVVVPNYTLCPAATVPQIVGEVARAVAWTHREIARFGGDPARIVVAGHSAGGHLAAMMLATRWSEVDPRLPADAVRTAVSVSGLFDLEPIMHTPFLQPDLRLTPGHVEQASPARLPAPPHGQLISVVGGDESAEFQRQNELIRSAWGDSRVPVCESLPGLNHFSVLEALATPGHRLQGLTLEALGLA